MRLSLFGIITITAPNLPYALVLLSWALNTSWNAVVGDLMGIAAGHIYYFFTFVWSQEVSSGQTQVLHYRYLANDSSACPEIGLRRLKSSFDWFKDKKKSKSAGRAELKSRRGDKRIERPFSQRYLQRPDSSTSVSKHSSNRRGHGSRELQAVRTLTQPGRMRILDLQCCLECRPDSLRPCSVHILSSTT